MSLAFLGKNPFNQRRQTASEDDFAEMGSKKNITSQTVGDRKNTAGTLNRNESQSQLTTNFNNNDSIGQDSREVELKA